MDQVLDHEIVHVLLGRAFGPRPVPHWLQEGMAQLLAREYTEATTNALARGLLGDSLISLDGLSAGFPADPVRAQLAYAQSADLVAYIRNRWGQEAIQTLVHELAGGHSFHAAIHTATGQTVEQVDAAWRGHLDQSYLWLRPLVSETALFGLAAVIFVGGGVLALRRRRRRLKAWADEEAEMDAFASELERRLQEAPRAGQPTAHAGSPGSTWVWPPPPGSADQVH